MTHSYSYRPRGQRKTANRKLPSDPSMWTDAIYEQISREHPYVSSHLQGDIDWSKEPIDEDEGNGAGEVIALVGSTPIRIPVVVREFELKPLDLYVRPDGELDYLDSSIILDHFDAETVQVGDRVDPYFDPDQDWAYTNSFMGKIGSYDRFSEDAHRMLGYVREEYPSLSESCDRILEKSAASPPKPYDTLAMRKGVGGYHATLFKQGHVIDRVFIDRKTAFANPKSRIAKLARKASSDPAIDTLRTLDKEATISQSTSAIVGTPPQSFESGDSAILVTESGEEVEGVVFSRSFLTNPVCGDNAKRMFIADDGAYTVSPGGLKKGGRRGLDAETTIRLEDAREGDRGFIAIPQPEGEPAMAGPVHILRVFTNAEGEICVKAQTPEEGVVKITLSNNLRRVLPMTGRRNVERVMAPASAVFVPAKEELIPTTASTDAKLASTAIDQGLAAIEMRGSREVVITKTASSQIDLSPAETEALLMSMGATQKTAAQAVRRAVASDSIVRAYGLERPVAVDRGARAVSRETQQKIAKVVDLWTDGRDAICKLAMEIPNENLQDQMTAMNTLNQYNAVRFSDAAREIEKAKHAVASLLYKARTGEAESISEDVARDALVALDGLSDALEKLEAKS